MAALLLSAAGCMSVDAAPDGDPTVQRRSVQPLGSGVPAAAAAEPLTAAEGAAAADDAERLLAQGNPAAALETVRRALLGLPPREEADRLRGLRARAKKELLRTAVARAEVSAPGRVAEGDPVPVRVRLANLSPAPLVVPDARGDTSPTTVLLRVTRRAYDAGGDVRVDSWEERHVLPAGTVPPGGEAVLDIPVDTARFTATRPRGFVEYAFGGTILPSGLLAGEAQVLDRIPMDESLTVAFPQKGWEEVAADPAAHLERGLAKENPVRVLVAAACLPAEERPAWARRLSGRLREGRDGAAVQGALRAVLRWMAGDREADLWAPEVWEARLVAQDPAGTVR